MLCCCRHGSDVQPSDRNNPHKGPSSHYFHELLLANSINIITVHQSGRLEIRVRIVWTKPDFGLENEFTKPPTRIAIMLKHVPILPPEFEYPIDDWRFVERVFHKQKLDQNETLFSVSNGYVGIRGAHEEARPAYQNGTYINGFYETWPIIYGERAYGFAKTGQTIVNVPDAKRIRLYVDDESFYLPSSRLLDYERALDMRAGTLDRTVIWELPSKKQVKVRSRRLVSLEERHVAAIEYEVTLLNAKAPVVMVSEIRDVQDDHHKDGDPRRFRGFRGRVLMPEVNRIKGQRIVLGYQTRRSKMTLACGIDHTIDTECHYSVSSKQTSEDSAELVFSFDGESGQPIRLIKYIGYHSSSYRPVGEMCDRAEWTLDRVMRRGFDHLLQDQRAVLDDFWERSDVRVDAKHPRAQQCIRWNLFQLFQASARAERTSVPAKGLTAQGYEGHYFWDVEIYLLPFLIYTSPHVARNLLWFRYSILDKARQRAVEVNQKGALFPWRTINGEEASAYYAAGTAQYHINADIVYALRKYVEMTGDTEFLLKYGTEILVETSRLWVDLGFFSEANDGQFCLHGVTGPDEYTTVVNNNLYTNMMARENLRYAVEIMTMLQQDHPDRWQALIHKTRVNVSEIEQWREAAEKMYIPFHEKKQIHLQDEDFLKLKPLDLKNLPPEKFPLLLHYHPLVIYRHRVIKQADLVLAMFLLGNEFSQEQKRRNFDFYDPLTTGDSSLSACIQSIVATEIGYLDKARDYFLFASLVDLADIAGNVRDGCHIASIGGTWMALIYGFAGMREYDGKLSFKPTIDGDNLKRLRFPLTIRGQRLHVDIRLEETTYLLVSGESLTIGHCEEEVTLEEGKPVRMKNVLASM